VSVGPAAPREPGGAPCALPAAAVTEDRLLDGRVVLCQPRAGYRAAIDPVLLAAAAPVAPGQRVLDLGCGVGAAGLCLLARVPQARVTGVEIQPELLRLAAANARRNGAEQGFEPVAGDIAAGLPFAPGSFDQVLCNPPHLPAGRGTPTRLPGRAWANQERNAGLRDWLAAARLALRPGGVMTLIHRADRLEAVLAGLALGTPATGNFGALVICPLWPKPGRDAKRVLVQARLGRRSPTRLTPGFVLHEPDGRASAAAEAVLRGGAALPL